MYTRTVEYSKLCIGFQKPNFVGAALYTVCGIIDCLVEDYTKEFLPFMAAVMLELVILVFLPDVVRGFPI